MVFYQKIWKKAFFIVKMTGPAGQFWLLESAPRLGKISNDRLNEFIVLGSNQF